MRQIIKLILISTIFDFISDSIRSNGTEIDIFSNKGKYIYSSDISFPKGFKIKAQGIILYKGFLYVVLEDENGEITLNKYLIKEPE